MPRRTYRGLLLCVLILLAGCALPWAKPPGYSPSVEVTLSIPTSTIPVKTASPTATATSLPKVRVWTDPTLPGAFRQAFNQAGLYDTDAAESDAAFRVTIGPSGAQIGTWIFALVAPFPTLVDQVSSSDLRLAWAGNPPVAFQKHPILVDSSTRQVFEKLWGPAGKNSVRSVAASELLATSWKEKNAWAIVAFEALQPRWKVLRVDQISPYDRNLDAVKYGLAVSIILEGKPELLAAAQKQMVSQQGFPWTNRDSKKLTVFVMTGVTALVRGSAWFMEQKGINYPGRDIREWLRSADITHVSNEVSFNPNCPPPLANDPNLRFCSSPKYIQLLEDVGVDVVELTGNHLNDFGRQWLPYTLELYKKRNWIYYGAGLNQEEARRPVIIEHNGNRLALIGCNPNGPKDDWATEDQPGTADCDYPSMAYLENEVKRLRQAGYQVIVTFQYFESYDPKPLPMHYKDFRRISDAGAVIVSGSQAHLPQAMELRNDGFIHYGVSNLFFDQMETFWPDTKDEFIDRHIFYDGRYIGTELLTARLEDFVKPRPMTSDERTILLTRIFSVSGWSQSGTTEWR